MYRYLLCVIATHVYFHIISPAQVFNISSYTTEDGLIQSQVPSLLEDGRGFLWFGTHRGVSQFDGRKFINFVEKDGITGNFVSAICEDQNGDLWFGTDQGLNHFNGQEFTFFTDGRDALQVQALIEDPNGFILVGTRNQGLILFDRKNKNFHIPADASRISPSSLSIQSFCKDSHNRIWVGTNRGLFLYQEESLVPQKFPVQTEIYKVFFDLNDHMWVGTSVGVFQFNGQSFQQFGLPEGLPNETIYGITQDLEGNIWFGTGRGIAYYDQEKLIQLDREDNLLSYRIRSAMTDREGNIWMGTDGGGLRKITRGIFRKYDIMKGMNSNIAKSFLEDDNGNIWISTFDQGINVLGESEFKGYLTEKNGLGGNDISFSYKDSNGHFWFASYTKGLTHYDGTQFTHFNSEDGLISDAVYCISEDPLGHLMIGTDDGISVYKNGIFSHYPFNKQLIDQTVYSILNDTKGRTWIGTPVGTTLIYGDSVVQYPAPAFSGNTIITILEGPEGDIWLASADGMTIFDDSTHYRLRVSEASGANSIVSMIFEKDKYLWIGTENGAYRLSLSSFSPPQKGEKIKFEHYTRKDGLPSMECNANAIYKDSKGNLWLGTSGGAAMRPEGLERKQVNRLPNIHITAVRTALEGSWQELGYDVEPTSGLPLQPTLPHSTNRIEFEFIGISLNSPQQVEYRYKLDGLESDWSPPTRQTNIAYSNLNPNTYTFRVIAKKESEVWDYANIASFTFTVEPAVWQRWWFRSMAFLLFLGIAYLISRQITAEKRRKREEQAIKDRAEKLQLEHQALYAMMNPHFTFNALQSIQYFIHRQDRIKANKFLSSFAKLIRKNLESTRTDFITLQEEVDRLGLYLSLEQMRFPEKFTYDITVSPELDPYTTLLPPMILQPFVENSIKHGIMPLEKDGQVCISIEFFDEEYLSILIEDNGIGVETSKKLQANRPRDHVSRGMQITMDRLALFARMTGKKYKVNISETNDAEKNTSGTRVMILLPFHY